MAGYSGTPLAKKLGVKPGHRLLLVQAPEGFEALLEGLPEDAAVARSPRAGVHYDVIVLFSSREADLVRRFPAAANRLTEAGGLWVSWPKKASGVATDLTEDVVRRIGLATGLVDNKICAVDETWSGLRFVVRVKDRAGRQPKPEPRATATRPRRT